VLGNGTEADTNFGETTMLEGRYRRGFSPARLAGIQDPRVRKDYKGYFMMSLSENTKVYFDDFYAFLEQTYHKAKGEKSRLLSMLKDTATERSETIAYYRAKAVVIDLLLKTIRRFYTDGASFGVIMTPWCFGTVMLEKVEVYRDRIARGEVHDHNIPDYPYYVIKYIDEIHKVVLLELFDFPEKAFQMRWQYSELLKRYSGILSNITASLQSVLNTIKNHGS
jgi:hypothetical protein